jgi:nucleoside-diphosphate-sugar epimerase
MRVFLAGATGVVGRRLVPLLVAAGHEVTGLTRRASSAAALRSAGVTPVVADVYDAAALAAAVREAAPEVVVHQLTDLAEYDTAANARLRVTGTRNLVDAALAAGARRIVAQSIAWSYAPGDTPAAEDVPLDVATTDARRNGVRAVAALEGAVREAPEWVVLRYGLFYGPGTWYHPDGLMADRARAGQLPATGDVASLLHVDDAAPAALAALSWPSGTVNVCDDDPAPGLDWVPAFCAWVGAPPPPTDPTRAPWARGATNHHARHDLGWTPSHPSWRTSFGS